VTVDDVLGAAPTSERPGSGLRGLAAIAEISLLAVPDEGQASVPAAVRREIRDAVVEQCEQLTDRFAILALGADAAGGDPAHVEPPVRTSRGAVYYPWVRVRDPGSGQTYFVPPHGHVAGVYARTDLDRGVHAAPANVAVRGIASNVPGDDVRGDAVSVSLTTSQVQDLNGRGVNVIRDLRAHRREIRVWGARTMAADAEWKYVNIRRLFMFLEHSIDRGTQWTVFEPNEEATWRRVRQAISDFLTVIWRQGALVGATPEQAFFVKCDRTTMTQNDIDNGRLVILVGAAPLKSAEFVILRIGHQTAVDSR